MSSTKPTFYKVEIKPKKKEPCRICNTKIRPTIDILGNKDLLESITSALDLMVFPESRLSKRICVICMTLVNLLADFKKVCYDTQNDLWKMEQNLVSDRSMEVQKILAKAKQIITHENSNSGQQPSSPEKTVPKQKVKPVEKNEKNAKTVPQMRPQSSPTTVEPVRGSVKIIAPAQKPIPDIDNYSYSDEDDATERDSIDELYEEYQMEEKLDEVDEENEVEVETTETAEEKLEEEMDVDDQDFEELENEEAQLFKCRIDDCEQVFQTKEELKEHMNEHKSNLPQIFYRCQVCTKAFLEISELVAHRKIHSTPNSQKCGYCRTEFPVDIIAKHVVECAMLNKRLKNPGAEPEPYRPKQVIVPPDEKLFKCGICGERAATIGEYKIHFASHGSTLKS